MGRLIDCGFHQLALSSIVCVHLLADPKQEWIERAALPARQASYYCRACLAKLPTVATKDLRAICIHCIRRIWYVVGPES